MQQHCEPGEIPGVFQQSKEGEEGDHHRQNDGDGISERHGDDAVLTDEQVLRKAWQYEAHGASGPGVDEALEDALLHQVDERAGAEFPHQQPGQNEHHQENRYAPHRVHAETAQFLPEVVVMLRGRVLERHQEPVDGGDAAMNDDDAHRLLQLPLGRSPQQLQAIDGPGRQPRPEQRREGRVAGQNRERHAAAGQLRRFRTQRFHDGGESLLNRRRIGGNHAACGRS